MYARVVSPLCPVAPRAAGRKLHFHPLLIWLRATLPHQLSNLCRTIGRRRSDVSIGWRVTSFGRAMRRETG